MAVPAFVGAGSGVAITAGTSTVSKTGCTKGNLVVLHTYNAGTTNDGSRSNITNIETIDGLANELSHTDWRNVGVGPSGLHLLSFGRIMADGTVSVDLTVGASGEDLFARIYEFSGVQMGAARGDVMENVGGVDDEYDFGSDTDSTVSDIQVSTSSDDRLALSFLAIGANETVAAFSGESGGDWAEAVAEYATGTGATATLSLQAAELSTGTTIDGGVLTLSGSRNWGIQALALKPAGTGPQFVGAGDGSQTESGVLSLSKANCVAGNLIVLQVLTLATTNSTIDAATNVENLAGTDNALTIAPATHWTVGNPAAARHAAYFGRVIANGTVSIDVGSISGTAGIVGRIYEFEGVLESATAADLLENTESGQEVTQAAGTSTTISNNGLTTTDVNRLGIAFIAINASRDQVPFSGETGGDWIQPVGEHATGVPAGTIGIQIAELPGATTVAGGAITITSAGWGAALTSILPAADEVAEPGRRYKRLAGPVSLGTSAATLYTTPVGTRTRVRHVHVSNPTAGAESVVLSIGPEAASTRFFEKDVPAADVYAARRPIEVSLAAGEVIQGFASATGLVVVIDGVEEAS